MNIYSMWGGNWKFGRRRGKLSTFDETIAIAAMTNMEM